MSENLGNDVEVDEDGGRGDEKYEINSMGKTQGVVTNKRAL